MIYNFRFDRPRTSEILDRVRDSKTLSQGWGGREFNLPIGLPDFVTECKKIYQLRSTRIPTSLTRIRNFKDGDILVTPHLPKEGKVSIHVVDGDFSTCYSYLNFEENHLNHQIRIKESYGLDGNISIYDGLLATWYAKLPWMRLPIQDITKFEAVFSGLLNQVRTQPQTKFESSGLDEYLTKWRSELLTSLREKLQLISPSLGEISFEKVCERLLVSAGYRIERRNYFDREGGDADFRCVRDRSDASSFETGEVVLLVQVKKHIGSTGKEAVEQVLQMNEREEGADACVMSLCDNFSDDAVELAKNNGVLLMNGEAICKLLLSKLAG